MIKEKIVEQEKERIEEVMKSNLCYVEPLQGEDAKGRALRHKRLHYIIGKHTKREKLKKK